MAKTTKADIADVLWNALGNSREDFFERPDRPWGAEEEIGRIRTQPGFLFDDDFWDVFHVLDLHVCHVVYYGPERLEQATFTQRMTDTGVYELRYTWRRGGDDGVE